MKRAIVLVALAALLATANGCTYARDRLKDTVDILGVKIVGGPGSKMGVGFGSAKTGLNFGYYRFEKFGFQGRAMGVWEETGTELLAPADHRLEAVWDNKEIFDQVAEFQALDGITPRSALFDKDLTYPRYKFNTVDGFHLSDAWPGAHLPGSVVLVPSGILGLGDIQVTIAPLFAGIEVNFSIYQLADWFTSWFYIDIAKDDTRNYTPQGPRND